MSFHDTESRLRDYLADKARAVPDDARPPALVTGPTRRRTWPALAAAAAIAAVLTLTVPLLVRLTDQSAPPVAGPDEPPSLGVPYILSPSSPRPPRTLYDGATKVPLRAEDDIVGVIGRVAGGWLVEVLQYPAVRTRVGVVDTSGRFRQIGPDNAGGAVLSPDRSKAAIVVWQYGKSARPHVVDIASGRILASVVPTFPMTYLAGWNADGIWLQAASSKPALPYVWRPGASRLEAVGVDGFETMSAVLGSTSRMVVTSRSGERWCLRVVERRVAGGLVTLREHCGAGENVPYPVLSADGRVMAVPENKVAIEVDTGRKLPLKSLPQVGAISSGDVFEDAQNLLVVSIEKPRLSVTTASPPSGAAGPQLTSLKSVLHEIRSDQVVSRCNVRTGKCDVLFRSGGSSSVSLGSP